MWYSRHLIIYATDGRTETRRRVVFMPPCRLCHGWKNRNEAACGIHAASSFMPWMEGQKQGGMWYSHRLVIYTARGGPSGGIRKKRNEAACGNPRRLVVRAAGMSHDKEVGIGGAIRAPSLVVIAESSGERPCCPLHILPAPLHTLPSAQLL